MPLTPHEPETIKEEFTRHAFRHAGLGLPAPEVISSRLSVPAAQRLRAKAIELGLDNSSFIRALVSEAYERRFGRPIDSLLGT